MDGLRGAHALAARAVDLVMRRAFASIVVALAALAARAGEDYETDGWHISVPSGWHRFQPDYLGAAMRGERNALGSVGNLLRSRASFTSAPESADVNLPCIVTSFDSMDTSDSTLDEIRSELDGRSAPVRWTLDRAKAQFTAESSVRIDGAGTVTRLAAIRLGRGGVAHVDLYCRAAEVGAARTEFGRVLDSFRWDAGKEYAERTFFGSIDWVYVIGGAAAVLIAAFFRFIGREISPRGPRPRLRRPGAASPRRRPAR